MLSADYMMLSENMHQYHTRYIRDSYISRHPRHGSPVSYSGASTIIIYIIRICGLYSKVSMPVNIDIEFYGPQFLIPYIMIVEAPL
jgi:hypothetical protein